MKKLLTLTLSLLMAFSLCLTVSAEDNAFEIGDQTYKTFGAAITAANSSTETTVTINMLGDYKTSSYVDENLYITNFNKNIVLNLNGKTLTISDNNIVCEEKLTITDNSTDSSKWGKIETNNHKYDLIGIRSGGELILERGTINNDSNDSYGYNSTITVYGKNNWGGAASKVTINGGYINSVYESCIKAANEGASVEVNGGTLYSGGNIFEKDENTSITVNGGNFLKDVSEYLASNCNIIKQKVGDELDEFKVVKNTDQVTVDDGTKALIALSSANRFLLNYAGSTTNTIKDENNDNVSVNSSTQLVLEATKIANMTQDDIDKVVEKTGTEISKLSLLPLDITLTAINDGVSQKIAYLGDGVEMPVTLYLSGDVVSAFSGKTIKVVRFHDDDVPDVIPASLSGNVLTFTTGKFSTYVIAAYSDAKPTPSPTPTPTPSTSSETSSNESSTKVVTCEEAMGSKNWTWSESKKACVYKVTNTSAE